MLLPAAFDVTSHQVCCYSQQLSTRRHDVIATASSFCHHKLDTNANSFWDVHTLCGNFELRPIAMV